MLKVFLVEDEIIIREGIKHNIDWINEGFTFIGEASDGELAFPMIQNLKPDILITDIKMPFMDGLELSRLVKKELPDIKIIILNHIQTDRSNIRREVCLIRNGNYFYPLVQSGLFYILKPRDINSYIYTIFYYTKPLFEKWFRRRIQINN